MKTARELYPENEEEYFCGFCGYQPIVDSFGEVLVQVDDDDYQGDTRVLYQLPDGLGILFFGWGSCSGCDGLQACDSYEDIDELIQDLNSQILRYPTPEEALKYFVVARLHDGTLYDFSGQTKIFFRKSRRTLMKMIKEKERMTNEKH